MSSLKDKVIAITGGVSGIGLATAKVLLFRGAKVSIIDIQDDLLESVKQDLISSSSADSVLTAHADVRSRAEITAWIDATTAKFGRLDGAANLAGVIPPSHNVAYITEQDDDEWEFVMGVNLTGVMNCMRAQLPHMQKGASIVNAGSALSLQGREGAAAYAASKHAVVGLSRSVAKEVGPKGIRVNSVAPGYTVTPMMKKAESAASEGVKEDPSGTALGRMGQAEETANLICFLLSEEASYITGATYTCDGGWNC